MTDRVMKTEEEWRQQLTDEQYRITRLKGTEPGYTGKFWDHDDKGTYRCVCCGAPLFDSEDKFDSGTGWPSFSRPISEENVETEEDERLTVPRTEVHCRSCGAHLGHVFPDGPMPTGLRFCINSASLAFDGNGKQEG